MTYAAKTEVSVEKSRAEIERTLERFGADQFGYARDDSRGMSMIEFRAKDRQIRFILQLPDKNSQAFTKLKNGWQDRTADAALKLWEQACRQRWRALCLCIKAKLSAVEAGITDFESEFLAHIVLPNQQTTGEWFRPQLEAIYTGEQMPRPVLALPAPTDAQ